MSACIRCAQFEIEYDKSLKRIATLEARLAEVERENVRLAQEHTQCHEQNNRLVSEHYTLQAKLSAAEQERGDEWKTLLESNFRVGKERDTLRADLSATRAMLDRYKAGMTDAMDALNSSAILLTRVVEAKHALAAALEEKP